jgi:hypothetical protein
MFLYFLTFAHLAGSLNVSSTFHIAPENSHPWHSASANQPLLGQHQPGISGPLARFNSRIDSPLPL